MLTYKHLLDVGYGVEFRKQANQCMYPNTGAQISVKQQGDFGNNIRDYLRLPAC